MSTKRTNQPKKTQIRAIGFRARKNTKMVKRRRKRGRRALTPSNK